MAVAAGLLGAGGVAISAAAAHRAGGSLATTAGQFCLFHASALLGLSAMSRDGSRTGIWSVASLVLFIGTVAFAGDLALAGLFDLRPFPPAAPIGGSLLIGGWILVALGGTVELRVRRAR